MPLLAATVDSLPHARLPAAINLALALANIALLAWGIARLRGLTLVAPLAWAIGAIGAIAGVEAMLAWGGNFTRAGAEMLRYAAACAIFCPVIALLGAKRPQDRAWQLIVLSLWGILALPVLEAWLARAGGGMDLRDARGWFLVVLAIVTLVNGLPTRNWLACLLLAAGQCLLHATHLPVMQIDPGPYGVAGAMGLLLGATGLVIWRTARATASAKQSAFRNPTDSSATDLLWLDFRDAFGALWAARVAERVNHEAETKRWGVRLRWHGLVSSGKATNSAGESTAPADSPDYERVTQSLRSMLLRFVSPAWVKQRLSGLSSSSPRSASGRGAGGEG